MKKRLVSLVLAWIVMLCLMPMLAMAGTAPAKSFREAYTETGNMLMASASSMVSGDDYQSDWKAFGLARAGKTLPQSYIDSAKANFSGNPVPLLALKAAGVTPSDQQVTNMVKNYDYTGYITNAAAELLALDACGTSTDLRETLISHLLSGQQENGAWGYTYDNVFYEDMDSTCIAVQALAPYYGKDSRIMSAIDKSLTYIKNRQNADGSFGAWGPSVETTAQVITALTSLRLDPVTYCGRSCIDGLLTLSAADGGFISAYDANITNAQGYYALVAYERYLAGKNTLYDMTPEKPSHSSHGTLPDTAEVNSAATGDGGVVICAVMAAASSVASAAWMRKRDKA